MPKTWTSKELGRWLLNLFGSIGPDLELETEDPSDPAFIDYAADTMHDMKVPAELITVAKSWLAKGAKGELEMSTTVAQRQDSLYDQLVDLVQLANKNGMYDAADWLQRTIEGMAYRKEFHRGATMSKATIASKLLAKGETALAREVLALEEGEDLGLSMVWNALQDLEKAFVRVEQAMMSTPGTDMDSDVIKQLHEKIKQMTSSYVQ